jgi:branched-chain amino acid transport system substrate-binding protein
MGFCSAGRRSICEDDDVSGDRQTAGKRVFTRTCNLRANWAFAALLAVIAFVDAGLRATHAQTEPLRIGVLTDMSSLYADNSGRGSVVAAQMAVEDFGGAVLGRKIEVISADHQNKADVGSAITRRWIDNENVEAILDVANSAVALAVQGITRDKKKLFLATGAATSRLTGDECSPTGIHWTYDTYALAQATTKAVSKLGDQKLVFSLGGLRAWCPT